jgi:hypothetical protein
MMKVVPASRLVPVLLPKVPAGIGRSSPPRLIPTRSMKYMLDSLGSPLLTSGACTVRL